MSTQKISAINQSDDEFFDAESENAAERKVKPAAVDNEVLINELINEHRGLNISDKLEDIENKNNTDEWSQPTSNTEEVKTTTKVEEIFMADEVVDEDALREIEKDMTDEELLENKEKAEKLKLEANELFKNGDAEEAIDLYTLALRTCPTKNTKERAILYGNRAAAKIKLDAKKSAIEDCTKAIEMWPEYVRALLRRAKLYEHEDKLQEALDDYKRIYDLDRGHKEAREAVFRLTPIVNERTEKMKEEMIGKLKDLGNLFLNPFGLSTDNFQMQQDPNTGGYSINFNQKSS